jgi:hypothetical protein
MREHWDADAAMRHQAYLVCLVVVLRVELEHLWPLLVVEGADQLLHADASILGPPLFTVNEPGAWSASLALPYIMAMILRQPTSYIFLDSSTLNLRARRNRS